LERIKCLALFSLSSFHLERIKCLALFFHPLLKGIKCLALFSLLSSFHLERIKCLALFSLSSFHSWRESNALLCSLFHPLLKKIGHSSICPELGVKSLKWFWIPSWFYKLERKMTNLFKLTPTSRSQQLCVWRVLLSGLILGSFVFYLHGLSKGGTATQALRNPERTELPSRNPVRLTEERTSYEKSPTPRNQPWHANLALN